VSSVDHSAAGAAAGFEQQRQLALVLLCEAYARDPAVKIRLEAVEDIDVISDEVSIDARVQVKHHLSEMTLTDSTPELWRTFAVWMDLLHALPAGELPQLHLATTSSAHPESGASLLGPEGRELELAEERLLSEAREGANQSTRGSRERFLSLDDSARRRLLRAIIVLDGTSRVSDLDGRLRAALGLVVPSERPTDFLERVQGWWVGRSARLLSGEIPQVSGADLYRYCDALRDEFRRGTLTTTEELYTDPTESQKAPLEDKVFIRQLKMVMASSEALDLAVRHYYRAFAQRGRWVRDLEDLDDDLTAYERRLCDEWEIAHVALRSRLGSDEDERCRAGLDLAHSLGGTVSTRLRGLDEPVLCRGTLHGLADGLRIGWHPDFRDRVSELLEGS
jgi:hypothetical protein